MHLLVLAYHETGPGFQPPALPAHIFLFFFFFFILPSFLLQVFFFFPHLPHTTLEELLLGHGGTDAKEKILETYTNFRVPFYHEKYTITPYEYFLNLNLTRNNEVIFFQAPSPCLWSKNSRGPIFTSQPPLPVKSICERSLTASSVLSLSMRSANLFISTPLSDASMVRHGEPKRNASLAACTAMSTSAWKNNQNSRNHL